MGSDMAARAVTSTVPMPALIMSPGLHFLKASQQGGGGRGASVPEGKGGGGTSPDMDAIVAQDAGTCTTLLAPAASQWARLGHPWDVARRGGAADFPLVASGGVSGLARCRSPCSRPTTTRHAGTLGRHATPRHFTIRRPCAAPPSQSFGPRRSEDALSGEPWRGVVCRGVCSRMFSYAVACGAGVCRSLVVAVALLSSL